MTKRSKRGQHTLFVVTDINKDGAGTLAPLTRPAETTPAIEALHAALKSTGVAEHAQQYLKLLAPMLEPPAGANALEPLRHTQQKACLVAYFWFLQKRRPDLRVRMARKAEDLRAVENIARDRKIFAKGGRPVSSDTIDSWSKEFKKRPDDDLVKCRRLAAELREMSRSEAEARVNQLLEIFGSAAFGGS